MTTDSFSAAKRLRVTFILSPENSNGVFPGTNSNTLVLEDLRVRLQVQAVPGAISTNMSMAVYGMRKADMNALTTIFFKSINAIHQNTVIVDADSGDGYTQVFSGMITEAQPVYDGMPAAFFQVTGIVGYQHQINPVPPSSYRGSVSVATVVADLAGKMGYAFENDGVTAVISNPYLPGTYWDQLQRVCYASYTQYVLAADTLAIYPYGLPRTTVPTLTVSPADILQGYPGLEKYGLKLTTLFNPGLVPGGRVKVVGSDIPNANGLWFPFIVDHILEANIPGGLWQTVSQCQPVAP